MKYTVKYPIHPKPKKTPSGASLFANGGIIPPGDDDLPTNEEYRAYQDSNRLYKETKKNLEKVKNAGYSYEITPADKESWLEQANNLDATKYDRIYHKHFVLNPKKANILNPAGTYILNKKIAPVQEIHYTDDNNWDRTLPIYKKPIEKIPHFAFGGKMNKYPTGGFKDVPTNSFYSDSTNQIGSPQVNTVPDNYGYKTKSGKKGVSNYNPNSTSYKVNATNFSGSNLANAAAAAGTGIASTVTEANAATNKQDKDNAIVSGTVNTTRGIVDTVFPIVGTFDAVSSGIGSIYDASNPNKTYTSKDGKTVTYKEGAEGDSAAAWKASFNPFGNVTNAIESFAGSKDNHGRSNFGMGIGDLFAPFITEGIRNYDARKYAESQVYNDSNILKNQQATFPNGGFMYNPLTSKYRNKTFNAEDVPMAYGGNLKSEVTGNNYLKDQVSDFTHSSFKTHENGGVKVSAKDEVEKNEVIYKDYVFSDRLKDKQGNSFAQRAKKLISQIQEHE